jgi:hypothetical protein
MINPFNLPPQYAWLDGADDGREVCRSGACSHITWLGNARWSLLHINGPWVEPVRRIVG